MLIINSININDANSFKEEIYKQIQDAVILLQKYLVTGKHLFTFTTMIKKRRRCAIGNNSNAFLTTS